MIFRFLYLQRGKAAFPPPCARLVGYPPSRGGGLGGRSPSSTASGLLKEHGSSFLESKIDQNGSQKIDRKFIKNRSNIDQISIKNETKIDKKSVKIEDCRGSGRILATKRVLRFLGGLLGRLGGLLGRLGSKKLAHTAPTWFPKRSQHR